MFLGIYVNELKTYIQTKTYTQMFVAPLYLSAQTWKQPRCLSADDWVNKL